MTRWLLVERALPLLANGRVDDQPMLEEAHSHLDLQMSMEVVAYRLCLIVEEGVAFHCSQELYHRE